MSDKPKLPDDQYTRLRALTNATKSERINAFYAHMDWYAHLFDSINGRQVTEECERSYTNQEEALIWEILDLDRDD